MHELSVTGRRVAMYCNRNFINGPWASKQELKGLSAPLLQAKPSCKPTDATLRDYPRPGFSARVTVNNLRRGQPSRTHGEASITSGLCHNSHNSAGRFRMRHSNRARFKLLPTEGGNKGSRHLLSWLRLCDKRTPRPRRGHELTVSVQCSTVHHGESVYPCACLGRRKPGRSERVTDGGFTSQVILPRLCTYASLLRDSLLFDHEYRYRERSPWPVRPLGRHVEN